MNNVLNFSQQCECDVGCHNDTYYGEKLQICVDASLLKLKDRSFTCSGAICINTGEDLYKISPDSTNNHGEVMAAYLGVVLAHNILNKYPGRFDRICIYSDSQFTIYGLTKWLDGWIRTQDANGTFYNTNKTPVANQDLFKMLISYCVMNRMIVYFYNQRGHVNSNDIKELEKARKQFFIANSFNLPMDVLSKISIYNNRVDMNTRNILCNIDPDSYPKIQVNSKNQLLFRYLIPEDYYIYIRRGEC